MGDKVVEDKWGTNKRLVFMYDENGAPNTVYYYNNSTSATKYYYVLNLQGDVTEIRSTSNALVAQYNYDAFGNILSIKDANGANITSSTHIANVNPLRYRGYFYDTETGFYYLNSRYYDPATRRFISADMLIDGRDFTGLNLYAYCGNNPVMRVDPNGDEWWHWVAAAAVVVLCGAAVVVTAGGAAPAVAAVAMVGSGTAAASTASTVAAGAFIGSSAVLGTTAFTSAMSSSSFQEFCDNGNWGTVATTAGGALLWGASGYNLAKSIIPKSGIVESGISRAPKSSIPNSQYIQNTDNGDIRSITQFNEMGLPAQRTDYMHPHAGVQPHVHVYEYNSNGQRISKEVFDINNNKIH